MKRYSFIVTIIMLLGCTDTILNSPSGSITGFVKLYSEFGVEAEDKSGIKVSLDATRSVVTDALGKFTFTGVEPGVYKIMAEKEGYGMNQVDNYIFATGEVPGVIRNLNLIQFAQVDLQSPSIRYNQSGESVVISGVASKATNWISFRIYFSDKPDVDNKNYITSRVVYQSAWYEFTSVNIEGFWFISESTLASSSPLYAICYQTSSYNWNGAKDTWDSERGKYIDYALKQVGNVVKLR